MWIDVEGKEDVCASFFRNHSYVYICVNFDLNVVVFHLIVNVLVFAVFDCWCVIVWRRRMSKLLMFLYYCMWMHVYEFYSYLFIRLISYLFSFHCHSQFHSHFPFFTFHSHFHFHSNFIFIPFTHFFYMHGNAEMFECVCVFFFLLSQL